MNAHSIIYRLTVIEEPKRFSWDKVHQLSTWICKVKFYEESTLKLSNHTLAIYLKGHIEGKNYEEIESKAYSKIQDIKSELENEGFVFAADLKLASYPHVNISMSEIKGVIP